MNKKVLVSNLPFNTRPHQLMDMFCVIGPVLNVAFVVDKETNRRKGVACVEFNSNEDAKRALSFNGMNYNGRQLKVFLDDQPDP